MYIGYIISAISSHLKALECLERGCFLSCLFAFTSYPSVMNRLFFSNNSTYVLNYIIYSLMPILINAHKFNFIIFHLIMYTNLPISSIEVNVCNSFTLIFIVSFLLQDELNNKFIS